MIALYGAWTLVPWTICTSVDNKELPYQRRDLRTLGLKAISSCMLITALLRQIITLNINTYSRCIFLSLADFTITVHFVPQLFYTYMSFYHRLYFPLANVCLHSQAHFKLCP